MLPLSVLLLVHRSLALDAVLATVLLLLPQCCCYRSLSWARACRQYTGLAGDLALAAVLLDTEPATLTLHPTDTAVRHSNSDTWAAAYLL